MSTQLADREGSAAGIPIVDFGGFYSDDPARRTSTVGALRAALEALGFCYLRNHGVAASVIDTLFAQSRAFFALPLEVKDGLKRVSKGRNIGYQGVGAQALEETRPWDLKETFQALNESAAGSANLWPPELTGFREAILAFHLAVSHACSQLMRALALSLGLPEDYFEPFYDHGRPQAGGAGPGYLRLLLPTPNWAWTSSGPWLSRSSLFPGTMGSRWTSSARGVSRS